MATNHWMLGEDKIRVANTHSLLLIIGHYDISDRTIEHIWEAEKSLIYIYKRQHFFFRLL